jgi:hypothetical protein
MLNKSVFTGTPFKKLFKNSYTKTPCHVSNRYLANQPLTKSASMPNLCRPLKRQNFSIKKPDPESQ